MTAVSIAFDMPDNGNNSHSSESRPIDFAHLAVQTMGDKELEAEVLHLFARQARAALQEMAGGANDEVVAAAHRLRSAANAVGAFAVAAAALAVETDPDNAAARVGVAATVIEAENFILKLSR
ncbi:Hpt domain-containing protein [Rhizobium sp. SGZ-381]|uniref:Hpt domain-containing protein n=1 Tax=Rhizobium sp. SGZ-381 TaxID=3342800 RepID=UPI00366C59D0